MSSITISIVSHGHGSMVSHLLDQIAKFASHVSRVIVTYNLRDEEQHTSNTYPFDLVKIVNESALGFGANHNQAFQYCKTKYFCVLNPDINFISDPFTNLLSCFEDHASTIVAPHIVNLEGESEDSARFFPTPVSLVKKLFFDDKGSFPINQSSVIVFPDWVGGMFLLIPSDRYRMLSGFNESYFLYYEDVDLCIRCWNAGFKVVFCKMTTVTHDARRSSRKNLRFFWWHFVSASRFFVSHWGRFPIKNT